LNKRGEQYLDQEYVLKDGIVNGRGKLEVDDTIWRIYGPDLPKGARVLVVAVEGAILRVEPVKEM
jgi:membrane protein implicated in regulation of membrane protease activity